MMMTDSVQPRRGVTPYKQPEGAPRFLSDMIIELGLAAEEHVNQAVETARSSGATVGQILVQEGRLTEDDLARALAARYGLSHIDLSEFEVDPDAANLLPPAAARRYKAVPLSFEADGSLLVAMADPSDSLALSDIAFMTHLEVQAAVAAANLIADLAARLPLPPSETGGSRFPTGRPAPAPAPAPDPDPIAQAFQAPAAPLPPAVDTAELDRLRAELEQANATIDTERSKHAEMVAELRHQPVDESARAEADGLRHELEGLRTDLERTRSDLDIARSERDTLRGERDAIRGELETMRGERESARGELDTARSELDAMRGELDAMRGELETARNELETVRGERDGLRGELENARKEATANAEAGQRLGELEKRLGEAEQRATDADRRAVDSDQRAADSDRRAEAAEQRAADAEQWAADMQDRLTEAEEAERRVAEAHSMVEKMRHDFEIEREEHAAGERELRARLASEEERHVALKDAHAALQKRVEVLRTQHAALLDAYATAKRWSEEFARGARELAGTLEQPVLDDALRSREREQAPQQREEQ